VINDYLTEQLEPFPSFRNSQEKLPDSFVKELDTFYVKTYEITKLLFCIQKNDIKSDEYSHLEIHFFNEAEELLSNIVWDWRAFSWHSPHHKGEAWVFYILMTLFFDHTPFPNEVWWHFDLWTDCLAAKKNSLFLLQHEHHEAYCLWWMSRSVRHV